MQANEKIDNILKFWFGHVEETIVPSENRARVWFGESAEIDSEIKQKFNKVLEAAIRGECKSWEKTAILVYSIKKATKAMENHVSA